MHAPHTTTSAAVLAQLSNLSRLDVSPTHRCPAGVPLPAELLQQLQAQGCVVVVEEHKGCVVTGKQ